MIDIYTEKKELKDWILQNDLYFNLNTGNEEMSPNEIKLIWQVDEAKLTPDKYIETKYGLGTIRNLSSGCKTLLNIVKHPDKVVCVEECGPNVLKIIFTMDHIKIYMSRPSFADIPDRSEGLLRLYTVLPDTSYLPHGQYIHSYCHLNVWLLISLIR